MAIEFSLPKDKINSDKLIVKIVAIENPFRVPTTVLVLYLLENKISGES